jgi:hypothetical protein
MPRGIAWGIGKGLDGKESTHLAIQEALNNLGSARPAFAIVIASREFVAGEVLNEVVSHLGQTPIWGFSTYTPLTGEGEQPRSVIIALFSGHELKAQVHFWPAFAHDSPGTALEVKQLLSSRENPPSGILFVADGVNGDASQVCAALKNNLQPQAGFLAAGEIRAGRTFQMGGAHSASGALSMAEFEGKFRLGAGQGTGWKDIGLDFQVSKARGAWIQTLNGIPVAEIFSKTFGYPGRDWARPPLTDMARVYCLGIEPSLGSTDLTYRSSLHVEVDGSLRVNAPVPEGQVAHLLVGDRKACLEAARQAVEQAQQNLGKARPLLALVLVDLAWHYLFEAHQGQLAAEIQKALGKTPMVGAYTLGQAFQVKSEAGLRLENQWLQVIILGEAEG